MQNGRASSSVWSRKVENRPLDSRQIRWMAGVLLGAAILAVGLILNPLLTILSSVSGSEGGIDASFGYASLSLVIAGLCLSFGSATEILRVRSTIRETGSMPSELSSSHLIISNILRSRIFLLSAALYGIFYSLGSGIIVYDSSVNFSAIYHVSIPSSSIATCCSPLGQTPVAVAYLTEHLGLLLVPVNLVLLFSISWLVGINASLASFTFSLRVKSQGVGWLGMAGAMTGLFTSCPTCAGLAIFSVVGGTGALSAALFLGPLQALLIAVSLPILIATPILVIGLIRRKALVCPVPRAL